MARVHGAALGGGAGLVAACDIAVAALGTRFGFTEVRLGLIPAVISPYVVGRIGESAARELFLTGERFDAGRAREIGLVRAAVPEADLDAAVDGRVRELLQAGPRRHRRGQGPPPDGGGPAPGGRPGATRSSASPACAPPRRGRRACSAFLEKRKPDWLD